MARGRRRVRRNSRYRMTPKRRAALKKAQEASARRRSRNKKIGIAAGIAVGVGAAVAGHKLSGSELKIGLQPSKTGKTLPRTIQRFQPGPRTAGLLVRASPGKRALRMEYRLGRKTAAMMNVEKRYEPPIRDDSVPLYNQKTRVRGWPHIDADKARRTNRRLRKLGMIP